MKKLPFIKNSTQVPNWFWRITSSLSPTQRLVLLAVMRKTYGFRKLYDRISMSQMVELTGLQPQTIRAARHELYMLGLLTFSVHGKPGRGDVCGYHIVHPDEPPERLILVAEGGDGHPVSAEERGCLTPPEGGDGHPDKIYKTKGSAPTGAGAPKTDPRVAVWMKALFDAHVSVYGEKPRVGGRDAKILKTLLAGHSEDDVREKVSRLTAKVKAAPPHSFWRKPITAITLDRFWNELVGDGSRPAPSVSDDWREKRFGGKR